MSQNPLLNSGVQDKTTGLKPALVAALSSLEVQLDQELARYRRTQNGYKTPKRGQAQQLTAISSAESIIQPRRAAIQPEVSPEEIKTHIPSASLTQETATPNAQSTLAPDANIMPAAATNGKSDHLSSNSEDRTPPEPNGYLESSEALLLSMNEEKPTPQRQTNASDSLLSPLGIGSILLLLMASLSLGYVLFNPKSLEMFKPVSTADTDSGQSNTKTVSVPQLTPIPKYPNLANNELPEVKDADDVVGLKPKPKPTITASFNPVTQESQTPKTSLNPATPEPTLSLPTLKLPQKPAVVPKKLATEIKPSKDGFYHVVIDDQGEVFASAKKVVHDAYKSPDGKLIFLGAAKTKEEAEKTLEELQAQGFKARIQQP